jgi:flagellar biogenesis protein FliO
MPLGATKRLSPSIIPVMLLVSALQINLSTAEELPLIYWKDTNPSQPPPPLFREDKLIAVAEHTEPATPNVTSLPTQTIRQPEPKRDPRRLAPRSSNNFAAPENSSAASDRAALAFSTPPMESLGTAVAGLAIVVGLFLLCAWLLRRGGPKPTSPLPKDVVAVLGRVSLVGRNFAQLIQIGNKLILVSITPDGVTTPITEVTDPAEVDRLLAIVMRNRKHSTTAEFQQVLQQLANEPAKGFLGS